MYMEILGLAIPHLKFRRPEAITPLVKPHGYRIWGLLEMVLHSYTDCRHTTERKGSLHTLVVTKTREAFRKEHREWLDRANMVRTHLEELDSKPSLKTLLGVEYKRIMCLSDVTTAVRARPGEASRQSTSRQRLSGTDPVVVPENPPQMAGHKRKASVVVDLCSDDK